MCTMVSTADHLALAILSLPEDQQGTVAAWLTSDPAFRRLIVRKGRPPGSSRDRDRSVSLAQHPATGLTDESRPAPGVNRREAYAESLRSKGTVLRLLGGQWAETSSGRSVAIPFAVERKPNRWWLGLNKSRLDEGRSKGGVVVVLLCDTEAGELLDFVLPLDFVENEVALLQPHGNGQIELNVRRHSERYLLLVPHEEPIDVSRYLGAVHALR